MARPNIRVGNIIFTLVGTVLLSTFFLATLYLQGVRNLSAEQVTFFYLPVPLGMLAGTQLASRFIPVLGARKVLTAGLLIQVVMLACWLSTSSQTSPLLLGFTVPVTLWAIGLGMSIVSSFVICTSGIAGSQAGTASGLATTSYQGGGAFGLALMAALATTNSDQLQVALAGHHRAILGLVAVTLVAFLLTRSLPQDQPASRHEKRAA